MIDRHIRNTRSKEESGKAHKRAFLTAIAIFVLFLAVSNIQKAVRTPFRDTGAQVLGNILAACVGIAIVGAVVFLVYKYGKSRQQKTE